MNCILGSQSRNRFESNLNMRYPLVSTAMPAYTLIKCSNCSGDLALQGENLVCRKCNAKYSIRDFVPDMLPHSLKVIATEIDKCNNFRQKFPVAHFEIQQAGRWLAKRLGIDEKDIEWGEKEVFRHQLAYALKLSTDMGLSLEERRLLAGMLGARNMSFKYKSKIADQLSAAGKASGYEAYEDILLREQIDEATNTGDVALIEIGSGVGRLLHQYGTCMSKRLSENGYRYRRFVRSLYSYRSIYDQRLRLLLGIDFEKRMIDKSVGWLERSGLSHLIETNRILQVRALVTKLNVNIDLRFKRIVTILFQTLGNQLGERLQIAMLKKAKELASPNGIVFVSVFNKEYFEEQAESYYNSIRASVGRIAYCKDGVFFSDKGVFSLWFDADQLRRLFRMAGMENVTVLLGKDLKIFPQYDEYVTVKDQEEYKKRAIIAIAAVKTYD